MTGGEPRAAGRSLAWLVAALAFAVYLPDLRNGFVYDDHEVILQQQGIRSLPELARVFAEPHGLPQSQLPYYRPITRATLLLQKGLHGDAAPLFHAANAALMSAASAIAFGLLRQPVFGLSPPAAAWGALAFAIHPIASECVHPIASGRESSIPALFMIGTLALWMRGRRPAAWLGFAAAMWSKEQAIVVPLLVAWAELLRVAPDPAGRRVRVLTLRLAPFAIVAVAYLLVRGQVVPRSEGDDVFLARLAAHWSAHPFGPLESLLFLVQSALAPSGALAYEPAFEAWLSPLRSLAAAALLAIVLTVLLRHGADRPSRRVVLFWLGWMPLAMLLNANLLPLEAAFAERYVFVSSLGMAALVAMAGDRLARDAGRRRIVAAAAIVVLASLAAATIERSRFYRDEIAFGRQWVATSPGHANAHASLGAALARAGRDDEAIAALREAARLEPALAAAHYNLGVVLARRGDRDEAIAAFENALRAWPEDPDAHYALGVLLAERGEREPAATHLREALRLRPAFAEAQEALRRLATTAR